MALPSGATWKGRIVARLLRETDVLVTSRAGVDGHIRKEVVTVTMMPPTRTQASGSGGAENCLGHQLSRFFASHDAEVDDTKYPNVHLDVALGRNKLSHAVHDPQPHGAALSSVVETKMERDSKELLFKTLERMQLSIAKKVQGKGPCVKIQGRQVAAAAAATVWKWDETEGKLLQVPPADFALLRNFDFWRKASEARFVITMPIPGTDDIVSLGVDSCPPTVAAARTFEKFDSYLYAGVPVVISVDLMFATNCKVDWFANGKRVCQESSVFIPTDEHIGCTLRAVLTPKSSFHDGVGCEETFEFKRVIEPLVPNTLLGLRTTWCRRISTSIAAETPRDDGLRVLSYNILADQNAFSADGREPLYPYVSRETLLRKRRFPLILHEILSYNPDVICLQEVDEIVYEMLLEPCLEPFGYCGEYSGKKNEGTREGCALFWNIRVLQRDGTGGATAVYISDLLEDLLAKVDASEEDDMWKSSQRIATVLNEHPTLKRIMLDQLGHLAQMLRFVDRRHGRSLWVLNTHLYFHPKGSHIRLMQLFLVARELLSRRRDSHDDAATLLCGDFNSSLQNAAGKLMMDLSVPLNYRDLKRHLHEFVFERHEGAARKGGARKDASIEEDCRREPLDFPCVSLPPSFPRLSSALVPSPKFTHYIQVFNGALDHVLFSDHLQCVGSAPMPTVEEVTRDIAMPSANLPSDHVSLVCDLAWRATR
jgi:mRNA deadenylase 3'-5' endonuclease subunit Ccr4